MRIVLAILIITGINLFCQDFATDALAARNLYQIQKNKLLAEWEAEKNTTTDPNARNLLSALERAHLEAFIQQQHGQPIPHPHRLQ